jgi:hypothetical protein
VFLSKRITTPGNYRNMKVKGGNIVIVFVYALGEERWVCENSMYVKTACM